jgi:hypothetical protein
MNIEKTSASSEHERNVFNGWLMLAVAIGTLYH